MELLQDVERGEDFTRSESIPLISDQFYPETASCLPVNEPNDHLLKALLNADENLDDFKNRLAEGGFSDKEFLSRRQWRSGDRRNILTIACETPKVNAETFDSIFKYAIKNFGPSSEDFSKNFSEPEWYYFEPIHFAAYHVNTQKLQRIVDALRSAEPLSARINAQTQFSENALHVLLEYGRQIESFNVQLSNGWESRDCHVIAKEKKEVVECANILIEAGIDVNHNNIWNETPLLIAIRYRLLEVIKLLLTKPETEVDLDTCKDRFNRKSARDLLKENEIHLDLLKPTSGLKIDAVKTLFTYLKGGNEEMFLRFNNENIRQYVNKTDGSQITMLQLCLIKGLINYEEEAVTNPDDDDTDILKSPMLTFFCINGFGRSIEHLLNNGADVMVKARVLGQRNVLEMAMKLNYYPFLAMLLEHKDSEITEEKLVEILTSIVCEDCNLYLYKSQSNARHALYLVITKLETFYKPETDLNININIRRILTSVMDWYLQFNDSNDKYKENICQLLRMGATLTGVIRTQIGKKNMDTDGYWHIQQETKIRLAEVSYETLKSHLDESIDSNNNISYDSVVLDDGDKYSETETLHDLGHDPKKNDLLNHPALIYLVHYKWLKCNKFFYTNLALYFFFLLTLYFYVISLQVNVTKAALKGIFCVFLIIQTLKELVQLVLYWRRYFCDVSNYLEITAIVSSWIIIVFSRREHFMIIAILLSSCNFLLMLGQLPRFTKYMIVFSSTKYFLEYAAFYFIQFLSFAVCFFILLPPNEKDPSENDTLGTISLRLFETLIYFIGQYDGDINSVPKFPIFGRFIVAVFIFCMTIILNNLLVGLIVTDMDVIQKNGKLQRQIKMIRFISRIETFLETLERWCRCDLLKEKFSRVFVQGQHKTVMDIGLDMFDEEDKVWLKNIHENRPPQKNVLRTLYEYIIDEIKTDRRSFKETRDIMVKLNKLEDQIRKRNKHK